MQLDVTSGNRSVPGVVVRKRNAKGEPTRWGCLLPDPSREGVRKWRDFDSRQDAERFKVNYDLDRSMSRSRQAAASKAVPPVSEMVEYFLKAGCRNCSPASIGAYRTNLGHLVGKFQYVSEMTTASVHLEIVKWKFSSSKISAIIKVTRRFLRHVESVFSVKSKIDWNLLKSELGGERPKDKEFLTEDEVKAIIAECDSRWDTTAQAIKISACYGLRKHEIRGLKVTDVDWTALEIRIPKELAKSRKGRVVPVAEEFLRDIRRSRDAIVKATNSISDSLFLSSNGRGFGKNTFTNRYLAVCRKLNIPNKPPHRLRAFAFSFLYTLLNKDMEAIRQICGWDSDAYRYYIGDRTQGLRAVNKHLPAVLVKKPRDEEVPIKHIKDELHGFMADYSPVQIAERSGVSIEFIHALAEHQYDEVLDNLDAITQGLSNWKQRLAIIAFLEKRGDAAVIERKGSAKANSRRKGKVPPQQSRPAEWPGNGPGGHLAGWSRLEVGYARM